MDHMETEVEGTDIEVLQGVITTNVSHMHQLACELPRHLLSKDHERLTSLHRAMQALLDNSVRILPAAYHLEVELSPQAYYRLGGPNRAFLRQEKSSEKVRYVLLVAGQVQDASVLGKGRTVSNLAEIGGAPNQIPHFIHQEVRRERIVPGGEPIWPQDVLNVVIKLNP